jgi:nucleoside-diphosphate-sugar epimerase
MTKLIFGCGHLGERVGRRWIERGERPVAVTRSVERAAQLARQGFQPVVANVTEPETLVHLPAAQTVFYGVAYDRTSGLSRVQVQIDGLRAVLNALPQPPARFIYVSSTSVYGNCEGAWVDENTPCRPDRESGLIALAAEQVLRSHPIGSRAIVLRLAGLYGPGRILRMRDLLASQPIAVPAGAIVNLIHVDDAASVVLAAEQRAKPPATYVVSDGHPVLRREFYSYLSELLHLPPPEFLDVEREQDLSLRSAGDKRVRNTRMLRELGVRLARPSYREGLAATLRQSDSQ